MIYLWDTDTFSWWERRRDAFSRHFHRLQPGDSIAISGITAYESLSGRIAVVAHARDERMRIVALAAMEKTLAALTAWPVIPYTPDAATRFTELRSGRGSRGADDLRIAGIALATDALLVTRNVSDYADIAGLTVENWID